MNSCHEGSITRGEQQRYAIRDEDSHSARGARVLALQHEGIRGGMPAALRRGHHGGVNLVHPGDAVIGELQRLGKATPIARHALGLVPDMNGEIETGVGIGPRPRLLRATSGEAPARARSESDLQEVDGTHGLSAGSRADRSRPSRRPHR